MSNNEAQRSLFVSNLPYKFKSEDLYNKFLPFGKIERIDIPNYHGSLKAIAFIHYYELEDAATALTELNGQLFQNLPMRIQYSNKENRDKKSMKQSPKRPKSPKSSKRSRDRSDKEHCPRSHIRYVHSSFPTIVDAYQNIPIQVPPQPMMVMNVPQPMPIQMPIQLPIMQQSLPLLPQMPVATQFPMQMQMMPVRTVQSVRQSRDRNSYDSGKSNRHKY